MGIIGLVDEATGYQEIRAKSALATILEKFIANLFFCLFDLSCVLQG